MLDSIMTADLTLELRPCTSTVLTLMQARNGMAFALVNANLRKLRVIFLFPSGFHLIHLLWHLS